ncbi:MAG: hypothetical protein K1X89_23610 [Myxococcaceae bacterium]|nr:hypothetical protein [Myxococcaceae bacterium]
MLPTLGEDGSWYHGIDPVTAEQAAALRFDAWRALAAFLAVAALHLVGAAVCTREKARPWVGLLGAGFYGLLGALGLMSAVRERNATLAVSGLVALAFARSLWSSRRAPG